MPVWAAQFPEGKGQNTHVDVCACVNTDIDINCYLRRIYLAQDKKYRVTQKKRELLKNPTKIEEIQEKNLLLT